MPVDKSPTLFNIIQDPSIIDGNTRFRNIVAQNNYKTRYVKYIQKHELIPFEVFFKRDFSVVLFHFRLNSENDDDVVHDVVFRFFTDKPGATAKNYLVQMFSNSPGFVFTHAYVLNKNKLLVPELADKLAIAVSQPPHKTNPSLAVGFDYTIFFCAYYLQTNSFYLRKGEVMRKGKDIGYFDTNNVATFEEAMSTNTAARNTVLKTLKREAKKEIKDIKKYIVI